MHPQSRQSSFLLAFLRQDRVPKKARHISVFESCPLGRLRVEELHHVVAEYINPASLSVSLSSLTRPKMHSIKRARSVYALSCITSPGGKHRGLAGSVAVLIAESLLMLAQLYTLTVAQKRVFVSDVSPVGH
jgi:hypothetical protein